MAGGLVWAGLGCDVTRAAAGDLNTPGLGVGGPDNWTFLRLSLTQRPRAVLDKDAVIWLELLRLLFTNGWRDTL